MTLEKKRQSNIELLRIISMLMIIGLHLLNKGNVLPEVTGRFSANGYIAWTLEALFLCSVNVFFLISGYFGASINLSVNKVLKFWLQIFTYSAVFGAIAFAVNVRDFNIYSLFQYIFPLVTNHYWFATVYFILLLISPLLSKGAEVIDKNVFRLILILLVLFGSISKSFIPMSLATDESGYNVTWMITVYLLGLYLKKYGVFKKSKLVYFSIYFISSLLILASMLFVRSLYLERGILESFITWGYSYNFIFCLVAAVALFGAFVKIPDYTGEVAEKINKIAGVTFGVYLFHEHMDIRYLWPKVFNAEDFINDNSLIFIIKILLTIICVFIIGALIEALRQRMMKPKENIDTLALVFLGLYSLRKCSIGIDLMDASYALGNYRFFDSMNPTWKLATYLANAVGAMLMKFPGGNTWVGMNFYTAILLGITSMTVYYWLSKKYPDKKCLVFLGSIIGLNLCWAPTVLLYHYMGFIVMTVVVIILFDGIMNNTTKNFIIAGIILGVSVFIRLPNISYVILIIPVVYGLYICIDDRHDIWKTIGIRVLQCIAGFALGIVPVYLVICIRYGLNAYPKMIEELFGMTDKATDYKPYSMITSMFETYIKYGVWLLLFVAFTIAGILFFKLVKTKNDIVWKILYLVACVILIRVFYGKGYFGIDYTDNFSVFKPCVTFISAIIILSVYLLFSKGYTKDIKLLAAFEITMIFISPLGGNNHVYSVMENMLLIGPVALLLLDAFIKSKKSFCITHSIAVFVTLLFIQTSFYGVQFVFHDLDNKEVKVEADIQASKATIGLYTSIEKNRALNELGCYLSENELLHNKVILYGDIPGISYIFDMEPAVFTTWPDLDSNVIERLEGDLITLKETPVIITSKEAGKNLLMPANSEDEKEILLGKYITENDYYCSYFNDSYYVFLKK